MIDGTVPLMGLRPKVTMAQALNQSQPRNDANQLNRPTPAGGGAELGGVTCGLSPGSRSEETGPSPEGGAALGKSALLVGFFFRQLHLGSVKFLLHLGESFRVLFGGNGLIPFLHGAIPMRGG